MKKALLYSLVGLSLSSLSFVAQAKNHLAPQVSTNPQFHHYSDYMDISTEDIADYINNQYTNPTTGIPEFIFNHVGKESGDGHGTNTQGAGGRYNEMFDAELEFDNALKRDNIIGNQVMAKYRDSHDLLWLKVRKMERYNAERQRLYSQHRGQGGWNAISGGSGIPKIVHLDVYGARIGNYRAEELAKYRLDTGLAPSGTDTPHEDDYGRHGRDVNNDHMNDLGWQSENVMTPRNGYKSVFHLPKTIVTDQAGSKPPIALLEEYMFNSGKVDSTMWGSDGYSAYIIERVKLPPTNSGDNTKIGPSDHLKNGVLPLYPSPDYEKMGHFVNIMDDENVDAAGTIVALVDGGAYTNYADVDEFGMKHTAFPSPVPPGLQSLPGKGKDYVKVIIKTNEPNALFNYDITVDGTPTQVYDSTGKLRYDPTWGGGVKAAPLYDSVKHEYHLYVKVPTADQSKPSIKIQAVLGGPVGQIGTTATHAIQGIDPNTAPTNPHSHSMTGEKKTGDDFRTKTNLFTTPGDLQNALLGGPFLQQQAFANYQNITVNGAGKIALDDPKVVIEYDYSNLADKDITNKSVAYLSNRGIVMATNGAKAVKLNDTRIFVNEGVIFADQNSTAIQMNGQNNIIQLRNDLIEGVIDGGAGQNTLLLSNPKHQMDERGLDKSAPTTNKYTVHNVTLKNIQQIHAQSGNWYFQNSTISLGSSNLRQATTLPWAHNDASGLKDSYDYKPQSGNVTFQGDITVDGNSPNPVVFAQDITFKGKIKILNLTDSGSSMDFSNLFNARRNLTIDYDNIEFGGQGGSTSARFLMGKYNRPLTGSVLFGSSQNMQIIDNDQAMNFDENKIAQMQGSDPSNLGNSEVGAIAGTAPLTVNTEINANGENSLGVWSGFKGTDITIKKVITALGINSKAIELNHNNNTLTLQDDITGIIDTGSGNDTLVLSATATNKAHHINGKVVGITNIKNTKGSWVFSDPIELSLDTTRAKTSKNQATNSNAQTSSPASPAPAPAPAFPSSASPAPAPALPSSASPAPAPALPSSVSPAPAPAPAPSHILYGMPTPYPYTSPASPPPSIKPVQNTQASRQQMATALGIPTPFTSSPASPAPAPVSTSISNQGSSLTFNGKLTFNIDPVKRQATHITSDHVDLKAGYDIQVASLKASPGIEYSTILIKSPDIKNENKNQTVYKDKLSAGKGLWKITTNRDNTGLHAKVKASSTVDYNYGPLDNNDDITFGISNQVAQYRTNAIVAHGSNYLDLSMSGATGSAYQDLSLIETHLNVSMPFKHAIPLLNQDSRNLFNIQMGYYHGTGTQDDFNRSVNAYTTGGSVKIYNILNQHKNALLRNTWLSTGFDFGLSQQYNIARHSEHFNQNTTKGKENDIFTTNTILSGLDLYVHFKSKPTLKFSITPYMGVGFNLTRLGEYSETAVNPLTITSQYRFNSYGIFGTNLKATYKLKNSQLVSLGANIETNLRFNPIGHNRNYSYVNFNSGTPKDNDYKQLPFILSLNASYQPKKYISIFTKLSGSTQEMYNYNMSIGAKILF